MYEDVRKSELKPLVSAREDADHFICLVERKNLNLDMLTGMCQKKLTRGGKTLHLSVKCGIFMLEKKKMSVNGMIDRAKIAQRYITDEFVQSYKIYDSSMKNTYIDKATLAGGLGGGGAGRDCEGTVQSIFSACCGCKDRKDCISRISDPMVPSAKGIYFTGCIHSCAGG